ncbi:hypothetical protein V6N12_044090 [Hibiscus sabdariffa]|uniref:Uncharacterized protein n=1 Tax=Hibiscus sabdariffa TaxID=183260 RepID=A0ABR2DGB6_9ROSI
MSFTMNNSGAAIEVIRDRNGTDQVLLRNIRGASAKVSLHGGHVLSLRTDRGEELVFTVARQFSSLRMRFEEGYLYVSHSLVSVDRLSNTDPAIHVSFEFRLRVYLTTDMNLSLISRVRNINCKPFSFSIAYHTYVSISDISEMRVEGLKTLDYLDNLCQRERFTKQGDALTFEYETNILQVDRVEGLLDVGVWNPWEKKSKAMVDFGMKNTSRCFVSTG